MSRLLKSGTVLATVAILGFLTGWTLWNRSSEGRVRHVEETPFDYDADISQAIPGELRLGAGETIGLAVGIPRGERPPEYLDILRRRYAERGLRATAILVEPPKQESSGNGERSLIVDDSGRLQAFLRYSGYHSHGATLLYTADNRVKFHSLHILPNDLLRQLVEKYLLGEISYSQGDIFKSGLIGKRVEGLQCGSGLVPPSENRAIFLMPPGCSSCELNTYRELISSAIKQPKLADRKGMLLFAGGRDVLTDGVAAQLAFPSDAICSVRDPLLFDPYVTRTEGRPEPYLLLTNEKGEISELSSLPEFVLPDFMKGKRK